MSKLPISGLKWVELSEIEEIDWSQIDTEGEYGYILEVDMTYPKFLHRAHSNFPLAPQNVEISFENLSKYSKRSLQDVSKSSKFADVKLVSTFHPREEYVLHFKNLKLYLQLGMKLKKIRRVLMFRQSNFIAPYIEKCTEFRQKSKTKFEQDQFKKLANCIYGKTIQNVRGYMNVKIHMKNSSLQKSLNNPFFKNFTIISENLVQTNEDRDCVVHDRPLFVGFTILELSKHFMFDFFYNKLSTSSSFNIDLGMSDTDSFLFKVDNAQAFREHVKKFMDYSNYPPNHPNFSNKNKSKLGYFKDELAGKQKCLEFVGLKSKCYSMLLQKTGSGEVGEKKICKGLGRAAIKNRVKFEHYKQCLFEKKTRRYDFHSISSKKHSISTIRINKQALTHFDSKRFIYSCGIHSEPYGSVLIEKFGNKCPKCF